MWEGGTIRQFMPRPVKTDARLKAMLSHYYRTKSEWPSAASNLLWRTPPELRHLFV